MRRDKTGIVRRGGGIPGVGRRHWPRLDLREVSSLGAMALVRHHGLQRISRTPAAAGCVAQVRGILFRLPVDIFRAVRGGDGGYLADGLVHLQPDRVPVPDEEAPRGQGRHGAVTRAVG